MHRLKKMAALAVAAALLAVSGCSASQTGGAAASAVKNIPSFTDTSGVWVAAPVLSAADAVALVGFRVQAENACLRLYFNSATTAVAVLDKRSGKVWYSNDPDADADPVATDDSRPLLHSQLTLEYVADSQFKTIDNYTGSIKKRTFQAKSVQNGVDITYTIRTGGYTTADVPEKISNDRFLKFFVMSQGVTLEDINEMRADYKKDAKTGIWSLTVTSSDELGNIVGIMGRAGYAAADLAADNKQNGVTSAAGSSGFVIPLQYRLDNESLIVTVPLSQVSIPSGEPLIQLTVLDSFGGTKSGGDSYMFVPDGSGALINLGVKKDSSDEYAGYVYGSDKTIAGNTAGAVSRNTSLPVFGLKSGNSAFFAIIEDGEALATVNARLAGNVSSRNSVYPSYTTMAYQEISIGGTVSSRLNTYQKKMYMGSLRTRYAFLDGQSAGYMGMASYYRSYLMKVDGFKRVKSAASLPVFLETLCAVQKEKSFLGFSYTGLQALTTFAQASEMLQNLNAAGVGNVQLSLDGWYNKGLDSTAPTSLNVPGCLGGTSGLSSLLALAAERGDTVYPAISLLTTESNAKGYHYLTDSAHQLDETVAKEWKYDLVTQKGDGFRYVISPLRLLAMLAGFETRLQNLGIKQIAVGDIAQEVYADYGSGRNADRETTVQIYRQALNNLSEKFGSSKILTEGANVYALPEAGSVVRAPLDDSGYDICDQSIPFFSLVFHGLLQIAGDPLNEADDMTQEELQSLATGSCPFFELMEADNSALKETDYDFLSSNSYGIFKQDIIACGKLFNEKLKDVQDQFIVDYSEPVDGVYKTTFEKGKTLLVNTTSRPVTVDGVTVPAESCI